MPYIYAADVWCDECGEKLCESLEKPEGYDSDNEYSWDSDDYPKYVYDPGESDSPQHCAAGDTCENAIYLDGVLRKVGVIIGDLTQEGVNYVIAAFLNDPYNGVALYWMDTFDLWGEIRGYVLRTICNEEKI